MVMVQEREGEEKGGDGTSVTSQATSSPSSSLLKRPVSSTTSHSSLHVIRSRKKTRDLPDLSACHVCGLRYPADGGIPELQALRSQWRVLLLCGKCLGGLRSAELCSYCFSDFPKGDGCSIDCCECSCRVHLHCVAGQRGYVVPSELDPGLFTCIDCSAIPKFWGKRGSDFSEVRSPKVSLEEMVRDANFSMVKKVEAAARAKEKALKKAVAARLAAELARYALKLAVLAGKVPIDEGLPLRVRRVMSGSESILGNQSSVSSQRSIYPAERSVNGSSLSGESSLSICQRVEFCMKNKLCETLESSDDEPSSYVEQQDGKPSPKFVPMGRRDQGKECTGQRIFCSAEVPGNEEQASCSN